MLIDSLLFRRKTPRPSFIWIAFESTVFNMYPLCLDPHSNYVHNLENFNFGKWVQNRQQTDLIDMDLK